MKISLIRQQLPAMPLLDFRRENATPGFAPELLRRLGRSQGRRLASRALIWVLGRAEDFANELVVVHEMNQLQQSFESINLVFKIFLVAAVDIVTLHVVASKR